MVLFRGVMLVSMMVVVVRVVLWDECIDFVVCGREVDM